MKLKTILSELIIYVCNNVISCIPSHTIRLFYYRKVMRFKIGRDTHIFLHCKFDTPKGLVIGNNTIINSNCRLDSRGLLYIGNNVVISTDTIILTADHDMDDNMTGRLRRVHLDDYVWVGTRALVLPGITIKRGAVVAAGAVVTKNVEENSVVAGIPAKCIKKRVDSLTYNARYRRLFH